MFEWVHYQFPSRVYFERDATHKIGTMVRDIGNRVLVLAVQEDLSNPDELAVIKTSLEKHTTGAIVYDDMLEKPGLEELDTAAYFAKQCNADVILAFGSRTTFHAARAIALLSTNDLFAGDLNDAAMPLKKPPHPVINVPVGPSMGEESTPGFSIYNRDTQSAYHGYDTRLFPAMIFIDPNISTGMTTGDLSRAGIAVMSAAVETILSKKSNEITNSIALRSLELITRNLTTLANEPSNNAARMNVAMASMLCGMAHSNSLLGLGYSIAAATANLTNIDFFMAMAILLPHIMEYNLTTSAGNMYRSRGRWTRTSRTSRLLRRPSRPWRACARFISSSRFPSGSRSSRSPRRICPTSPARPCRFPTSRTHRESWTATRSRRSSSRLTDARPCGLPQSREFQLPPRIGRYVWPDGSSILR